MAPFDWNGKVLKEVSDPREIPAAWTVGGGYLDGAATAPPQSVFQSNMHIQVVEPPPDPA